MPIRTEKHITRAMPRPVEAAGVVIMEGGYKRAPLAVARDFVRAQSLGEWGDAVEMADAVKLAELLAAYGDAQNAGGPVIAPFAFGGKECLCEHGTETWCRAALCPRKALAESGKGERDA